MVEELVVTLHVLLPIVVGIVIGIIEAYFVYEDENMTSGRDFLGDMWHGLVFSILGVLVATNIPYIMVNFIPESMWGFLMVNELTGISLVACIVVTLFMLIKREKISCLVFFGWFFFLINISSTSFAAFIT